MTKSKKDENKEKPEKDESKENSESSKLNDQLEGIPGLFISYDEMEGMQKQIADLSAQSSEYLAGLQRERADFANYKRRIDQDNQNTYNLALGDLVKPFLTVIDDLERAIKHRPNEANLNPWIDGIALILQKLLVTLENQGIKKIELNPGDPFDPMLTEAVTHEESPDFTDGQIIEVLQSGYKIKDRIIRPALARVAK